jgi:mannan endo-1,4-beta-mannosidase
MGTNAGVTLAFDGNGGGVTQGHIDDVEAWNWNTIRINMLATDTISWSYSSQYGYEALKSYIDTIVQEYTSRDIVIMIASHDMLMNGGGSAGVDAPYIDQLDRFWTDMAQAYKSNPYVWFNVHNEPPVENQDWIDLNDRHLSLIRAQGAENIVVVDAPTWGQDLGPVDPWFSDAKYAYDATMAPALAAEHGNVVLAQHNYGGYQKYNSAAKLGDYIDRVHAAGIPLVIGEFGYTTDDSSTAGSYSDNRTGADAVFAAAPNKGVGMLWWHGTHNDKYSLKNDNSPFWTGGAGANLSEAGQTFWALTH